jgi:hypothetical protein
LADLPDGYVTGHFPEAKLVVFMPGSDKNGVFYNATPYNFPKVQVFACLSHPAEYSVQFNFMSVPHIITPYTSYFDCHLGVTRVTGDATAIEALEPYLKKWA